MRGEQRHADPRSYDVIVVGAGICGVVFLRYAREEGLRCLALEKQSQPGGVWNWLPRWQDIQNRREDFAIENVPLDGVTHPAVRQHVREWVRTFELEPCIELECEVLSASHADDGWHLRTTRGEFRSDYLIVASGVQNEPWIPNVERSDSAILERHSSALLRPEDLAGKRATIVGGGASSWDLLDLAIAQSASDVHWVYRNVRWFLPTRGTKETAWPNLRELALMQSILRSPERVTRFLRWLLRVRYDGHRLAPLEPDEPFDIGTHQLIPGRRRMTRKLDQVTQHRSEIRTMGGREVILENGERFETDLVLWATGYRMNLGFLDLPEYRDIRTLKELTPRLGSLVRSVDYPDLFFIGMSLADSTSATPFFAAVEAKSIVAHISGRCEIPMEHVPGHVAYWDLFRHFASFDRSNYPRRWWGLKHFLLAVRYAVRRNKSVEV